ncbi:MAG: aminodeoxychorismate/anthranilate synthase component II [Dermatophilaceae bacterium]
MNAPTRILVVDNYDSFVYTIVGYLQELGATCDVRRNDAVTTDEAAPYDGVLISPGPGIPQEAGVSMDMVRWCAAQARPMLGVCLGHQALCAVFGGTIHRAPELVHGKTSPIEHDGTGVLAGLPSPFTATRYHSLAIDPTTLPAELAANGHTASGLIMAVRHRELELHGVQFHPESVLTQRGHQVLATWLEMCGLVGAVDTAASLSPLVGDAATAAVGVRRA